MKTVFKKMLLWGVVLGLNCALSARAGDKQLTESALLSRLQEMSHGMYCDAEWLEVIEDIDAEMTRARAEEDWGRVVDMTVIKSRTYSMRSQHSEAVQLLLDVMSEFESQGVSELKKAYMEAAEIYAKLGKEDHVKELKRRFQDSDIFDDAIPEISGGTGPEDPILIERPSASGRNSVSLTALDVAQAKARNAPGRTFPGFSAESWSGRHVTLEDLRGQVVLVDLWLPGWHTWTRELAYQKSVYNRYKSKGFQIVGMCISGNESAAKKYAEKQNLPWTLVSRDKRLLNELGVFGEAANYLVDREGMIVGRNLYGANLDAAVNRALLNRGLTNDE